MGRELAAVRSDTDSITHADTAYDDAVLTKSAAVDTTGTWVATTISSSAATRVAAR